MQTEGSWNSDAPLVIAHRGASLIAPENTLSAFRLAAELGADAIELDVKLSRDGIPVVHHDMTLERTTTGRGNLKDHSLVELKLLDAGARFGAAYTGEEIPTLAEVLENCINEILLNVELTNYNDPFDALPRRVLHVVQEKGGLEGILFSSFNPFALRALRAECKEARLALLLDPQVPGFLQRVLEWFTPHIDLHPHGQFIDAGLVERIQRLGGRVNAWTINDQDRMVELFNLGINGIITDDVETALHARKVVFY